MARAKRNKEVDSRNHLPPSREVHIPAEGPVDLAIETVDAGEPVRLFADKAEEMAFMEEPVDILIHPTTDKNAEPQVYVAVNGRGCIIPRNKRCRVKRMYVERLAHAREQAIGQDVTKETPEDVNRLLISEAHKYPFSVLHDPNPKGAAWLQRVLTE